MAEDMSLLKYLSKALLAEYDAVVPYKFPDRAYDKLVKNCPSYLGGPAIYIGSNCHDSIEITLSAVTPSRPNPLDTIRYYAKRVINPDVGFTLSAILDLGVWQPEVGFRHLAEYISYVGCHEIPFQKWVGLNITLPNVDLPFDSSQPDSFPVEELENLCHLRWMGHRKQLIESWLPFTPSLLARLTTIDITCDLALVDCSYIIFYGRSIKYLTVRTIRQDLALDSVFAFLPPASSVERPSLESLTLESEDDIAPLLEPFNFPSLVSVTFHLHYPRVSSLHGLSFWKTVKTVTMEEYIPYNDMQGIRTLCGPETGFFHKDPGPMSRPRPFSGGIADEEEEEN